MYDIRIVNGLKSLADLLQGVQNPLLIVNIFCGLGRQRGPRQAHHEIWRIVVQIIVHNCDDVRVFDLFHNPNFALESAHVIVLSFSANFQRSHLALSASYLKYQTHAAWLKGFNYRVFPVDNVADL